MILSQFNRMKNQKGRDFSLAPSGLRSELSTIDVAHPPRHPDIVEKELFDAIMRAKNSSSLRVLKIIHGHGSSGKGGTTKELVRNWAFRNRGKFQAVIDGENYSVHNAATQEMRAEVGQFSDTDLENANAGITIIWIK
jgi:hypothetical protein